MMKDREQKSQALRLSVANRWFPQLELDLVPGKALAQKTMLVTDLDVFACIPDEFRGFRHVVFDCKTRAKESPVNRALWVSGVLERTGADQGFCILKKGKIEHDHILMANRLRVVLLDEREFDGYGDATCRRYREVVGNVGSLDGWDLLFEISNRFANLKLGVEFIRCEYWAIDDAAEACRKTLQKLRSLLPELDPSHPSHVALVLDLSALFARSLGIVISHLFKIYLKPDSIEQLSEGLLVMLYGGHEAYMYRNDLYKRLVAKEGSVSGTDLSLPEWDHFLRLARQLLDAPVELLHTPLILREVGFSFLRDDSARKFAQTLCEESPQGARFAVLVASYLCKAAKLPPEFGQTIDNAIIPLLAKK